MKRMMKASAAAILMATVGFVANAKQVSYEMVVLHSEGAALKRGAVIDGNRSLALKAGSKVTLVGGSLLGVVHAIEVSKATMRNIRQNLVGAFAYNTLGIPVAAGLFYPLFGWMLSPLIAGGAMAFSSVTVVTNANRLRLFRSSVMRADAGGAA